MDALRFAIAAAPLAAYLILMGIVALRRRPMVVTGAADLATLGAAMTGLALVGPISLFRPEAATAELGRSIWLFLLAFYWLCWALLVMLCRPRLVVYNATAAELRPALAEAVVQLDPTARWAGDSLSMPGLGVRLHLDPFPATRTTTLASSGPDQDFAGWRRLAVAVARNCRTLESPRGVRGVALVVAGAALLLVATAWLAATPAEVAVAWREVTSL